jgi:hypothetical protein
MDALAEQLFKLAVKLLHRRAVEPIIATFVLYITAMFVEIAGSLDDRHVLLYWLCTLIAVGTAIVGLGGVALYAVRIMTAERTPTPRPDPTAD